jgi:hypothetical protein
VGPPSLRGRGTRTLADGPAPRARTRRNSGSPPSDRPWNTPPPGKACPYKDAIDWQAGGTDRWPPYALNQLGRAAHILRDALWLLDDPIAHRLLEQVVGTRVMPALGRYPVQGVIAHAHAWAEGEPCG